MTRAINILHGDSAAGIFQQAMRPAPGELLVAQDLLSCGPLPPFKSIEQWTRVRTAYWDVVAPEIPTTAFNRDLFANTQAIREAESVVVWLGVGAADQLVLPWLIQFLELIGSRAKVSTVQFTQIGDPAWDVWSLGLLNVERMKQHPSAVELTTNDIAEYKRGWAAVTSPQPVGLLSLLAEDSDELRFFRNSLRCFVDRYPNHRSGLTRWDRELLRYTKERGPLAARIIGFTMGDNFDADLVGDLYLFARLRAMGSSQLAHPLVELSGNIEEMRGCNVSLAKVGQDVLDGRANARELNGIDDWVLGVHLNSKAGKVWYQKEGLLIAG